jgi:outer membrane protein insertion porin family
MNQSEKTIDLTFDMEKGLKVYIERISISGNTKTRDKVVRREMRLAEGQLYNSTGLKRSKQNIMNLGFFEEANVASAAGSDDNKMNINVEVKEKPTGTFSFGAGYSSVDGPVGQGSVSQSNFLGLGLKANLAASIGGHSQTYNIGITDPYFLDTRWTLGGDLFRATRDWTNYTQRDTGGDIKAGYAITDELSTYWMYKFVHTELYNFYNITLLQSGQLEPNSTTSSVLASVTLNTTDYRPEPTKGLVTSLSTEFAGLGGSTRFVRYIGDAKYYQPLFWTLVGSLKGTLGYMQTIGKDIPQQDRFYLGGINTIRGYTSRTVCPTSAFLNASSTGYIDYLGGDKEAVFNAEVVVPISKEVGIKAVFFTDAGYAWGQAPGPAGGTLNSYDQPFFSRFQTSYGAGIRWTSPMGPLRLEYGIPINPRPGIDNKAGRLEFSMGGFF